MLGVLTLARSTAHADDGTVHVAIHGAIDADALRARVAQELGATLQPVDGSCEAPCLEISVAGGKASVSFTPRIGELRARLVELGADRTQWPLVITLLAGNVVRDEAADLLSQLGPEPQTAGVPAPIDATPPPAPELELVVPRAPRAPGAPPSARMALAPLVISTTLTARSDDDRERMLLGVGLVPGLSTDWTHVGRVKHFLSLDLIAGVSGGSSGVTISGIADIERGDVWGFQAAGVTAIARHVGGAQVAGIAAVAGDLHGVQVAGIAAVADRALGMQIGGIATVTRRRADTQIAGIAAVAHGPASLQIAGVTSVAERSGVQIGGVSATTIGAANVQVGGVVTNADSANVQVAGVTNVARSANIQVSGVVNVARRLRGFQIAPINVARHVDGVQIGLINVGGSADGFSFGLINIVPGGRADVEAAVDSSSVGTLLFRHGGNRWHNVYGVGGHPVNEVGPTNDVWMYGLGFGPSWRVAHSRIDLEAIAWEVSHGSRHSSDLSILSQLRLSVAHGIGPFAIVVGGALNTYISNDHASPLLLERRTPGSMMDEKITVEVWPSAFVGVRL